MPPTRGKKSHNSVAKHNASGFAKRRANAKKNVPKSLDDVYEYATGKNRRATVKLTHDKEELDGLNGDNEDNEVSGVNMQAIRSRILDLGDAEAVINSEEDEEIDSDDAFEESDAEEYVGFSFPKKGSKNRPRKQKVRFEGEIDMEENEKEILKDSEVEKEGDESGEDDEYLDVLDVLDGRGEPYFEESEEEGVKKKSKSRPSKKDANDKFEDGGEESGQSDTRSKDDEDDSEENEESEEEDPFLPSEDDNDEENIDNLDSFITNLDMTKKRKADDDVTEPTEGHQRKRRLLKERTEAGTENEFNVRITSAPRLELDDLLAPLESTSALKSLKKSIKPLVNGNALSVPLPLRSQEKLDREAAYEQTKAEVDKWNETMKHIKQAEHLTFPLQAPQKLAASNAGLAAKFKPTTQMESAVDKLLRAANLRDDSDIVKTEELKLNHLSVEEVSQRRAELRKMRDLIFRAEIKAKRISKIKSKAYRKIHKKARKKLEDMTKEADGDIVNEEEERLKHEVERARERATLRHKNTGKWAKAMQARGELDIDQRKEIEEMLDKGERLRKKIQANDDSNDEDEDEDVTSDVEAITGRAFEELRRLEDDDNSLTPKAKGVFAMKFMQNAMAQDASRTNDLVDQFREEMERLGRKSDGVSDDDDENDQGEIRPENLVQANRDGGRLVFHPGQNLTSRPRLHLAPSESSSTLKSSDPAQSPAVASQLTIRSSPPPPNEDIPLIELSPPPPDYRPPVAEPNPWLQPQDKVIKTITKHEVLIGKHGDQQQKMKHQMRKQLNKSVEGRAKAADDAKVEVALDNVLVLPSEPEPSTSGTKTKGPKDRENKTKDEASKDTPAPQVDVAYEDSDADSEIAFQEDHLQPNGKENPKAFKQKDLVAMAFAGDNVVEDFAKLKKQEVEGDAPRDEDQTLPGWGSWGGRGVPVNHKAKKHIKKVPGIDPTTRADHGKSHIIISEKKDKKAAKYLVKDLPYPYTSKAQFEKTMSTPVGTEWNTRGTFQKQTLPRVLKKMGTVINPLEKLF